jgi:ubiquinone/menaquinone biosynthesis C-methylase UbiE
MNEAHKACGGDEWRAVIREHVLPRAMADLDFGDDVLEVGPGYGATTDVLSERVPQLTAVEIDEELAAYLADRYVGKDHVTIVRGDATALEFGDGRFTAAACFTMLHHVPTAELQDRLLAEVHRVLQPGAPLIAGDSLASEELEVHHEGDTYNPVDPSTLERRLTAAGFSDVEVSTNPFAWTVRARA